MNKVSHTPTANLPYLLWQEDKWWIAKDKKTGIASQGKTSREALENLDEAIELSLEAKKSNGKPPKPDAPWFK
jgi:predicted RNase H-like HicB family nuclease